MIKPPQTWTAGRRIFWQGYGLVKGYLRKYKKSKRIFLIFWRGYRLVKWYLGKYKTSKKNIVDILARI